MFFFCVSTVVKMSYFDLTCLILQPDMDLEQGKELVRKCIAELKVGEATQGVAASVLIDYCGDAFR